MLAATGLRAGMPGRPSRRRVKIRDDAFSDSIPLTLRSNTMNVLFLCTGNSCRSILGEAVFNHLAAPGWHAMSAGSKPTGQVHPRSLALLAREGIATEGYASKSWDNTGHRDHGLRQCRWRNLPSLSWSGTTHALGRGRPSARHRQRHRHRCGLSESIQNPARPHRSLLCTAAGHAASGQDGIQSRA